MFLISKQFQIQLKNDRNSKITKIQKWPKFKNDQNSKMTEIQKWPKSKNSKMTEIQKRFNLKNDLN